MALKTFDKLEIFQDLGLLENVFLGSILSLQ